MRCYKVMCDYNLNKCYKFRYRVIILGRSNFGWGRGYNRIGIKRKFIKGMDVGKLIIK